ncbi:MAG: hypothetical protein GF317_01500 [Candidatus Lokiarchaeota archaeon]|nr:hypothetical protein [Candidatus Lokiarchaeota archaeon]MBD3198619.1 hypothetical protein [Candidatus Lokiarchaeota archaeon]
MKRISFNLRIGVIGAFKGEKEEFLSYIKKDSVQTETLDEDGLDGQLQQFLILYKSIPIKLRIYFFKNYSEIIENTNISKPFDVIIQFAHISEDLVLNNQNPLEELDRYTSGDISYILVGRELNNLDKAIINRTSLVHYAKKLGFLYCFLIQNRESDYQEIFNKFLDDLIFKFQYSSPEIFERAKKYGESL